MQDQVILMIRTHRVSNKKERLRVLSVYKFLLLHLIIFWKLHIIYSPHYFGTETAKEPFILWVWLPTCLPHAVETSRCPFQCWISSREAVNTNFYSLWFDLTGNWNSVYCFSSRCSIHSTTDWLLSIMILQHKFGMHASVYYIADFLVM